MDGRAWWTTVHGVTKSWTQLSDFTFIFHFHALEKEMATHSRVLAWRISGKGEPGGLPSMGSHRVGHDWSNLAAAAAAARFCRMHRVSFHLFGYYCSLNYKMPRSLVAYPPNTSHTLHAPGPPESVPTDFQNTPGGSSLPPTETQWIKLYGKVLPGD